MIIYMEELRNQIADILGLSDNCVDGTYLYWLTRVKEAFGLGLITLDDFVEVDEELLDDIMEAIKKGKNIEEIKSRVSDVLGLNGNWVDGTYLYWLTRDKSAIGLGTVTPEDFVEIDEGLLNDIMEVVEKYWEA